MRVEENDGEGYTCQDSKNERGKMNGRSFSKQSETADIGIGVVGLIYLAVVFVVSMFGVNSCNKSDKGNGEDDE